MSVRALIIRSATAKTKCRHGKACSATMKSISSGITSARTPTKSKDLRGGRQKPDSRPYKLRETAYIEFLLELRANVDDGLIADIQLLGDAAIGLAFRQQRKGLQLPRRQFGERVLARRRMHQCHPHGEIFAQIWRAGSDLFKSLHQSSGRRVLEDIAGGAGLERARHNDGIAVHAEDQNARGRIVRIDAADQRQAAEPAALHGEVDDHYVGTMTAVKLVAGSRVARLEHVGDAGILEHAPAALQHDRMVVDDENAGHIFTPRDALASAAPSARGIVIRTLVPRPGSLSTL